MVALPHVGTVVLGVGDSIASVVGVRYGTRRWPGTHKTFEGSAAAAAAILLMLAVLFQLHNIDCSAAHWAVLAACTGLVCTLEAVTTQIDNLYLPLLFSVWLLIAASSAG